MTNEFNDLVQKTKELKNKIENEINQINKLYEKTIDDMTKSFLAKHENLIKEENDLKEKLENEVTKVKEKLEIYWSDINNSVKFSEKINLGIKNLEKEGKNMVKILSYVSKVSKNKKEMKKLFKQLIKGIKFSYQDENDKSIIKYEDYYFNGIPEPINIQFKDLASSSVNISWSIDNLNLININKNDIKYRIKIKKENVNEKYIKIYEGKNQNYSINNLDSNTNYEIIISSFYNDYIESFSQIQKIKTNNYISYILMESKRENEFLSKIYEWSGYKSMNLIYRGSRDGMNNNAFHNKCNKQGPTICLYKNEKGYIFGGYASISWTSDNGYHAAPDSFIFTLTNIHNTQPTKFPTQKSDEGVYHDSRYGPTFGSCCDIFINSDFINSDCSSDFPCRYQDILGKGKSIFTGDLNNNNGKFKLKEIEVFKLIK